MNVKGTRDFLPEEMILRQQVLDKIRCVFDTFGFQPMETPALESWETLSAKGAGGEDVFKECYNFEDIGGRRIGLRYEITVSLARAISENSNLPLPFKAYQIGKIWRYGEVSRGRLREFLQSDADIVGSESPLADAEVIACAISCFNSLGFKDFCVRLNSRKVLNEILRLSNISEDRYVDALRCVDKLDKISMEEVTKELEGKGISKASIKKMFEYIMMKGTPENIFKEIGSLDGASELKDIISYLKAMKLDSKVRIDLSLARGLDYYTGPIFEVFAEKGIGSIAGGGRYDKMIGLFLGRDVPATGISLGIERIMEVMKEKKMIEPLRCNTKVFVIAVNDKVRKDVLGVVQALRQKSIAVDYDLRSRSLSKQLEYASALGIPFAAIVGEKELKEDSVTLRDMKTGKEEMVKAKSLPKKF
ncbi:MAG: histidine--tRNA ligase [Candidatus Aenigmatarchaeota archaeon]